MFVLDKVLGSLRPGSDARYFAELLVSIPCFVGDAPTGINVRESEAVALRVNGAWYVVIAGAVFGMYSNPDDLGGVRDKVRRFIESLAAGVVPAGFWDDDLPDDGGVLEAEALMFFQGDRVLVLAPFLELRDMGA